MILSIAKVIKQLSQVTDICVQGIGDVLLKGDTDVLG
jgi:hypothetical protein